MIPHYFITTVFIGPSGPLVKLLATKQLRAQSDPPKNDPPLPLRLRRLCLRSHGMLTPFVARRTDWFSACPFSCCCTCHDVCSSSCNCFHDLIYLRQSQADKRDHARAVSCAVSRRPWLENSPVAMPQLNACARQSCALEMRRSERAAVTKPNRPAQSHTVSTHASLHEMMINMGTHQACRGSHSQDCRPRHPPCHILHSAKRTARAPNPKRGSGAARAPHARSPLSQSQQEIHPPPQLLQPRPLRSSIRTLHRTNDGPHLPPLQPRQRPLGRAHPAAQAGPLDAQPAPGAAEGAPGHAEVEPGGECVWGGRGRAGY